MSRRPRQRMRSEVLPCSGTAEGSSSAPAMVRGLTVDEHVLECRVCYLPLKPPIFQCRVGHVLCSSCSEKLQDARKCHLCGVSMPGGYQRCHAMEDVMNSIRGPCPHAPYGCDATPVYHASKEHVLQCPHVPCQCPGDGCSFVGSVTMLVEHLAAAHSWPCTDEAGAGVSFGVELRDGFNFLTAVRGSAKYLILLNMASTPFGRAISAVWIDSLGPRSTSNKRCDLDLTFCEYNHVPCLHYLKSRFHVACTCPSNGLPDPNVSFQFLVPKYVGGSNEAVVRVTAVISTISSEETDKSSTLD